MKTIHVRATGSPVARERTRPHLVDGRDINSIHAGEVTEVPKTAYYLRAVDGGSLELVQPERAKAE